MYQTGGSLRRLTTLLLTVPWYTTCWWTMELTLSVDRQRAAVRRAEELVELRVELTPIYP
ncbi:MAG TPA: hypothetical protein VKQ30_03650 [Ktedonobacterales bacterium]|nr:hypothetical protein [Ktedonobacterales bacterium]